MTDGKETVTGEVGKINHWKKKPGYFLMLVGKEQEFYGFGKCPVEVGQTVTFKVSPGTGNFEDKVKLDKLLKEKPQPPPANEKVDTGFKTGDRIYLTKEEMQKIRQNSIERQCALKAATVLVGELYPRKEILAKNELANDVLLFADKFLVFIRDEEPELPKPPEDE